LVVQIALGQVTKSVHATVSELRAASFPIILDTILSDAAHDEDDGTHGLPRAQGFENSSPSINVAQGSLNSLERGISNKRQ